MKLKEIEKQQKVKPAVLVIDDSSSLRQYVGDVLLSQGYEVHSAENGLDGLAVIKSEQPDVVLLDLEMPVMDGMEVLERLKPFCRNFAIIVLTSLASIDKRLAGFEAGADDYITKPFNDDELKARVKVAMRVAQSKKELAQARDRTLDLMYKFESTMKMAREEKKRANAIRMISGIAHHINNPLSFINCNINIMAKYARILTDGLELISGYGAAHKKNGIGHEDRLEKIAQWAREPNVQRIRDDMGSLVAETKDGLDRIANVAKRLMQLEDAGRNYSSSSVDMRDCLIRAIHSQKEISAGDLDYMNMGDDEFIIYANDGEIRTATENIIENALDSVAGGGKISIRLYKDDGYAVIDISDTGKGIAKKDLDMVFNPFFTTKQGPFRLGLGLTVAQYFIKASDGDIEIVSQEAKGTTVQMRFPLVMA